MFYVESVHQITYNNYKVVNIIKPTEHVYEPLNYPAIVEALTNYLHVHDLLLLSMVNNQLRTCLYNKYSAICHKPKESFIIDMINHQCIKCYTSTIYLSSPMNKNEQVKALFSLNKNKAIRFINIYLSKNNFKELSAETVNHCVKMVLNDLDFKHPIINHFEEIIRYNKITDLNLLKTLITALTKEKNNRIGFIIMNMYDNVNKEIFFILLPLYCKRDISSALKSEYFTEEHISLLLDLIIKYDNCYSVRNTLIDILLKVLPPNLSELQLNTILPIINKNYSTYYHEKLLNTKIPFHTLSNQHKLLLHKCINSTYDISFLDTTSEYNLISLELAKKGIVSLYTSKLSPKQILKYMINNMNNNYMDRIFNELLLKLTQLSDKDKKKLYKIPISTIYQSSVLHLLKLNIDEPYKIKLIEKAYDDYYSKELTFLDTTRNYNKLSLKLAAKHDGHVYVHQLSFEDKLKYIKKYENSYYVVKILIYHLKRYDIQYKISSYKDESILFESSTTNDDDIVTNKYYQLTEGKSIEYYQWLYEIKMINYKQYVYYSFPDIQKHHQLNDLFRVTTYKLDIIYTMVINDEFATLDFQLVLFLLKYYVSEEKIVRTITKHPFFDVFYGKIMIKAQ